MPSEACFPLVPPGRFDCLQQAARSTPENLRTALRFPYASSRYDMIAYSIHCKQTHNRSPPTVHCCIFAKACPIDGLQHEPATVVATALYIPPHSVTRIQTHADKTSTSFSHSSCSGHSIRVSAAGGREEKLKASVKLVLRYGTLKWQAARKALEAGQVDVCWAPMSKTGTLRSLWEKHPRPFLFWLHLTAHSATGKACHASCRRMRSPPATYMWSHARQSRTGHAQ